MAKHKSSKAFKPQGEESVTILPRLTAEAVKHLQALTKQLEELENHNPGQDLHFEAYNSYAHIGSVLAHLGTIERPRQISDNPHT